MDKLEEGKNKPLSVDSRCSIKNTQTHIHDPLSGKPSYSLQYVVKKTNWYISNYTGIFLCE